MELEAPDSSPRPHRMRSKEEDHATIAMFGALLVAGLVIAATAGRGSSEPAFGGTAD